ncbi:MAG TPA: nucleotidyltransferase domain-containing protein, partial [Clostridia bacterium]|nr:nucleotidyltransferase domain-containing protein [Clostridia bacterium]
MRAYAEAMARRIEALVAEKEPSIYLLGSCVLEDFRPGWSDIDLLCLLRDPLGPTQADALVGLRQTLMKETGNPVFRAFEGGILSWSAL